jgi:peptidoglycan pentaglycine glycine transferase (the first glycine)
MENKLLNFIQSNSPDGGFLQSEYWRKFQESYGRKTFQLEEKNEDGNSIAQASVITHKLPVVGDYFYVPRGPIVGKSQNPKSKIQSFFESLVNLARNKNAGWIRIEPSSDEELELVKENLPAGIKMKKSAVDMQSREILMLDVSGSDEDILARMKQKTRYNIRLSEKRNVQVFVPREKKHINEFLRLVKITAERDKITSHPENYYRKMFETISPETLKLYVAEFEGKVICANLVLFFGKTATYMHGASDNEHRNVMAPYLLQWQQIKDARKAGCERYDFGGIKTGSVDGSWSGITKFKTGFAPDVNPINFPGCWDIVLNPLRYNLYRAMQRIKRLA